jgi:hypothetical protein
MDEPERLPKYRKDAGSESRLQALNTLLHPLQVQLESRLTSPERPLVFIIGAPRSGTTLVSQLLARSGQFGYISNFVARFWLAPGVGAMIEQSLDPSGTGSEIEYKSSYGVTHGLKSPHEFGYFWSGWFDRGQVTHVVPVDKLTEIDSLSLCRRIASIERVCGLPLSFKNNTWCTFQAAWLADLLPSAIFVVCRRDPLYLAQSLLLARQERLGDPALWWSVRPPSYDHIRLLPWWEQVVSQALDIERTMLDTVGRIAPSRIVEAAYRNVCGDPAGLVREISYRCGMKADADVLAAFPSTFESSDVQNVDDQCWQLLQDTLKRFAT